MDKILNDVQNTIFPSFELPNIFVKQDANILSSTEEELHFDDSVHANQSEDLREDFSTKENDPARNNKKDNNYKEQKSQKRGAKKAVVKKERLTIKYLKGDVSGKSLFCVMCEQSFRRLAKMLNHVDKKHGPKAGPKCEMCEEIFDTYGKMDYHRGILHGSRISFSECGKVFPQSQLQDHMSNAHEVCEPISCEICGEIFTNRRKLKIHRKSHDGPRVKYAQVCPNKYKENCFCQLDLPNKRSKI